MPATILIGAQWGDEGKGRIADWLAVQSDVVARYGGGDNAGHTVYVGQQVFKLHTIPSGILRGQVMCVLGNGMVVDVLVRPEIDFERLRARAAGGKLFGLQVPVASIDDLLVMKRAANRGKDRLDIEALEKIKRGEDPNA